MPIPEPIYRRARKCLPGGEGNVAEHLHKIVVWRYGEIGLDRPRLPLYYLLALQASTPTPLWSLVFTPLIIDS